MTRLFGSVLAVALVGGGCSGAGPEQIVQPAPSSPAIIAEAASGVSGLPTDRLALPTFDYQDFNTLLGQLSAKGVPVVVNIWASWCGPCRAESPNLVKAAKEYGTRVQFLGVDTLDQVGPARAFIKDEGYPYPSVFDPTASIRDGLGYIGQPDTIFFDAFGRRVDVHAGAITLTQLVAGIRKILSAAP